jgi:hypothetical protein
MPDITTRLRQTRADMIGTADEQHYWDCYDAAAAIERLRLTDAEREAVEAGIFLCEGVAGEANENANANAWARTAGRLRGLLVRTK